ncbi:MAG: ATP-binding protein [Candidatus Limnocylindria bacterium]
MTVTDLEPGFLSLGQATARAIAQRAASGGRLQRTLLVHGPPGSDKEAFVDDLLALLFCTDGGAERRPCNACRGCRDARARAHSDLVLASPEAWREQRSTGESIVAAARRWLLDAAGAPIVAERRVVLIERADRANEQTQNALLKVLEEPTRRHMFVLVADEPTRLLPTIRSRCQPLRIGPVPRGQLAAWLVDRERLPADQAETLARLTGGMAGTAIAYARNPELVSWRRRVQAELLTLVGRGRADRFASVRELLDETSRLGMTPPSDAEPLEPAEPDAARVATGQQREAALLLVGAWIDLTRDLLVASAGRPGLAPAAELLPDLPSIASDLGTDALAAFAQRLEVVHDGLRQNAAPRLALEAAMLDWPAR